MAAPTQESFSPPAGQDSDDQSYKSSGSECFTPWSNPTLLGEAQPASDNLAGPSAGEVWITPAEGDLNAEPTA